MTVHNKAWQGILSPRQAEVLELIADGLTNQQIARDLGLGIETIRTHVCCIYTKLDIASSRTPRVLAARWWIEHVENGEPHQSRKHRVLNYLGCHRER